MCISLRRWGCACLHGRFEILRISSHFLITVLNLGQTDSHPSLFRSAAMVLLDNASVEYTFLERFFVSKQVSIMNIFFCLVTSTIRQDGKLSEENAMQHFSAAATWFQIMEPSLQHCEVSAFTISFILRFEHYQRFFNTFLESPPPTINLLTMAKLIDSVLQEVQVRQISPLESYFQKIRLSMWPVFQKQMHAHLEALRKLTSGSALKAVVKDLTLNTVSTASDSSRSLIPAHCSF